jgi:hypothetical protein
MSEMNIPTLKAEHVGDVSWRVWCSHCCCYHYHGDAGRGAEGLGHRGAHCHKPNSPYERTGYILEGEGK